MAAFADDAKYAIRAFMKNRRKVKDRRSELPAAIHKDGCDSQ